MSEVNAYQFVFPDNWQKMMCVIKPGVVWIKNESQPVKLGERRRKVIAEIDFTDRKVLFDDGVECALSILLSYYRVAFSDVYPYAPITEDPKSISVRDMTIDRLHLSNWSMNRLEEAEIETVGELIDLGETKISNLPNVGKRTVDEIKRKLVDLGVDLREVGFIKGE